MIPAIIGFLGMSSILMAFVLDEFYKKWNQNTTHYNLLNLLGSGLLIYYAYTLSSIPFMILNGAWFITAGIKLWKIWNK